MRPAVLKAGIIGIYKNGKKVIIPSIDIMGGKVVQLEQGHKLLMTFDDPVNYLDAFSIFGPVTLIDLDAAMGKGNNVELIKKMCGIKPCFVGGGIRTVELGRAYLKAGALKIIVGTQANESFLNHFLPDQVIAAVDTYKDELVEEGWKKKTDETLFERIQKIQASVSAFSHTFVHTEGTNLGIDLEQVMTLKNRINKRLIVAGGISSYAEIATLDKLGIDCFVGRAVYEGKISLIESFIHLLRFDDNGLIPAIIKNQFAEILMLGYMNKQSLQQTFATKKVTFWSRSRNKLWQKGETSGHFLDLVSIRADCDRDALLVNIHTDTPTCHLNKKSCFDDSVLSLTQFEAYLKGIVSLDNTRSYTRKLTTDTAFNAAKITEEALELIEATTESEIVHEAADLIYHVQTYLMAKNVSVEAVFNELEGRKKRPTL